MPEPTNSTLADQHAAINALFSLSWVAPHLPAPALTTMSGFTPVDLDLSMCTLADFEQWRQVIHGDPNTVELCSYGDDTWLRVVGQLNGTKVTITAHADFATQDGPIEPAAAAVSV
jgi:hypothetical protein